MTDDDHGLVPQLFKQADQLVEAPEVDARLRLVQQEHLAALRQRGGELDAFQFPARKCAVRLPVDVIARAKPHVRQIRAELIQRIVPPGSEIEQILHRHALEAHGLLKGERKAQLRPFGDGESCDLLSPKADFALRGKEDSHQQFYERGFSAPVLPGDHRDAVRGKGKIDSAEDLRLCARIVFRRIRDILQFQQTYFSLWGIAPVFQYISIQRTGHFVKRFRPEITQKVCGFKLTTASKKRYNEDD